MLQERIKTDILILGSGGAGLFAALHAHQANPNLDITVASKGLLGKSGCTGPRVNPEPDVAPPGDDDDDNTPPGDDDDDNTPPGDDDDDTPPGDDDDDDDDDDGPDPKAQAMAAAEALNDQGKAIFKNGDVAGAVAKFEKAADTYPDARFDYNLCVGYETLGRYDEAAAACQAVVDANPEKRLKEKAVNRLVIIKDLKKKK